MTPKYLIQDELGNSGQTISLTQGESKTLKVFLLNADGSPMVLLQTIVEIVVAVYTSVSLSSIKKKLSLTTVTKLISTDPTGCLGFEFGLTAAETATIVANSSGIPILITVTDSSTPAKVLELNLLQALLVDVPVVLT